MFSESLLGTDLLDSRGMDKNNYQALEKSWGALQKKLIDCLPSFIDSIEFIVEKRQEDNSWLLFNLFPQQNHIPPSEQALQTLSDKIFWCFLFS